MRRSAFARGGEAKLLQGGTGHHRHHPQLGALTGIRPGKLASRMLEEGMTERQVERVLRDTYFVSPERRRLCIETAEAPAEPRRS